LSRATALSWLTVLYLFFLALPLTLLLAKPATGAAAEAH
jgi:hypothetical protein